MHDDEGMAVVVYVVGACVILGMLFMFWLGRQTVFHDMNACFRYCMEYPKLYKDELLRGLNG